MGTRQTAVYLVDVLFAVKAESKDAAFGVLAGRLKIGAKAKVRKARIVGKAVASWDAVAHVDAIAESVADEDPVK